MLCKHCGRSTPDGKVCLLCGTPTKGNKITAEELKAYEESLKLRVAEEAKYEEERQARIAKEKKKTKLFAKYSLIIGLVAVLVIFLFVTVRKMTFGFRYVGFLPTILILLILGTIVGVVIYITKDLKKNKN